MKVLEKISFPHIVWEEAESLEDLEDWLLANDKNFIKKMRKAREEDLNHQGASLKEIREKYV